MLISTLIMMSFYIFRDDYIVSANNNSRLIEAYAAFSSVVKDSILTISPVILSYMLVEFRLEVAIAIILIGQLGLYVLSLHLAKHKINITQAENIY